MGVITNDFETTSPIPPAEMFEPLSLTPITSSTRSSHKTSRALKSSRAMEALDKENFTYCYSIIEGDPLGTDFEKISYEVKITASPDGGSMLKSTSKYLTIGEVNITEEEIKAGKEKADAMVKAIEASVVANPDACDKKRLSHSVFEVKACWAGDCCCSRLC
ncbi:hypothetical protein EUGRSUZ_A00176 [Eucalyptus grandis]|uniref:Bet v I/Major latex protein domain-containing protein n=2 Tax=Eucalyptus grandis TaxID=71139 RepID=A0A059DB21_EUCGR|nr:hypothetical protein EUGRSUZ_A00176 [Eucalyptus grandis]